MPGKATAVAGGSELRDKVAKLAADLGLEVRTEVKVGRSTNMVAFFHATGKAVSLIELEPWLRLFFGLPA
jgi:hypothetical protein